ncbi:MAG: bifunctional demethylmenaquinone methyltransferase/2-methoxy-6-polyprenyl-1,4-benzoquinol methylase UbiE [Sphingobacteriaceae bacterium]|nr:bifunctional demethylmenaquinone methyltransferase/2-methoxy-6-polyprenyl-1,4-benzoquinol methylase UbiE [Sphingobacteriaceae bacterium]
MQETVKPYPGQDGGKKEQVASMFDSISPRYDLLNRVLSLGIDTIWRKKAINLLKADKPERILDVATGTADLAIEALRIHPKQVVGVDISAGMLAMGDIKLRKRKLEDRIKLVLGDSEGLPFADNEFDAATVAFGVRNFEHLLEGLQDIQRVLKPGAKLVVLEFSRPNAFPVKQLYNFYFRFILPVVGRLVSKDSAAYTYLPASVQVFPEGQAFLGFMERAGFVNNQEKRLTFGICSIYVGQKG